MKYDLSMNYILCRVCQKSKSEREYYPSSVKWNNHICRECQREQNKISRKEWYRKNMNYASKKQKNYWKESKEKYGLGCGTIKRFGFELAIKIYDKFDRKCSKCGSGNDLTIHHLDNNGRNKIDIGEKPNNLEDNLVIICRRCHGSIHAKQRWSKETTK